ncbi:hypothetical protein EYF80_001655 [Liparis tanakae]|uniref:Uncharacterized protein n=1 Tax=Liparis tanakae TaxID=230148 RepID=A0A4Z2JE06_9TELE|nr:hypothetical protein EYF80_001655 [Liparis tanakae]
MVSAMEDTCVVQAVFALRFRRLPLVSQPPYFVAYFPLAPALCYELRKRMFSTVSGFKGQDVTMKKKDVDSRDVARRASHHKRLFESGCCQVDEHISPSPNPSPWIPAHIRKIFILIFHHSHVSVHMNRDAHNYTAQASSLQTERRIDEDTKIKREEGVVSVGKTPQRQPERGEIEMQRRVAIPRGKPAPTYVEACSSFGWWRERSGAERLLRAVGRRVSSITTCSLQVNPTAPGFQKASWPIG